MTTELYVILCGCLLALLHIGAAVGAKTRQYGSKWNMSARDEPMPPPAPLLGRLIRAQANFFETFPIIIAAALMLAVTERSTGLSAVGAWLWLGARIAYLPIYALGIPVVRTVVFMVSIAGLVMMLVPLFG